MNKDADKEIGGYLPLETTWGHELYEDAIKLNCARNGLRYVIRAYQIKEIHIPFYTCPTVWQAARSENCKIKFYHIDKNLMLTENFDKTSFVLYTNYYGVCGKNIEILSAKYPNLIVDNAHAFYYPKVGLASFNSPRKFIGVPDGCYLFCDKKLEENLEQDVSYQRCAHLLKRLELSANDCYSDFIFDDNSLNNQPIKLMSKLTTTILSSVDYEGVKQRRLENFKTLHDALKATNELNIDLAEFDVPMEYPYFVHDDELRKKLIKNKIYVTTYWSPLGKKLFEAQLQKYLLPLPIDQRYSEKDMNFIIKIIKE